MSWAQHGQTPKLARPTLLGLARHVTHQALHYITYHSISALHTHILHHICTSYNHIVLSTSALYCLHYPFTLYILLSLWLRTYFQNIPVDDVIVPFNKADTKLVACLSLICIPCITISLAKGNKY